MERHDLINKLSAGRYASYLEIGVDFGTTFNKVAIPHKVGVDPHFKVPLTDIQGKTFVLFSDDFFKDNAERFDCVFVDGLHTYGQSKRDFINAWACLKPGGAVIIDDCYPADELASLPDLDECLRKRAARGSPDDKTWMGDVYKTILWLNDCTDYAYAYVKDTMGIVVVWQPATPKPRKKLLRDKAAIDTCDYATFKTLPIPWASVNSIARKLRPHSLLESLFFKWRK